MGQCLLSSALFFPPCFPVTSALEKQLLCPSPPSPCSETSAVLSLATRSELDCVGAQCGEPSSVHSASSSHGEGWQTQAHAYTWMCTHKHIYTCMCICKDACIRTKAHVPAHKHRSTYRHIYLCSWLQSRIDTRIYAHAPPHPRTYTHMQVHRLPHMHRCIQM